MLAAVLQRAGYKVGLYTSPHLKSFTERIRVNGQPVEEAYVADFVTQHRTYIEAIQPSFFEATVGMAFHYFAQQGVDVAVVEVGMGGRLDSTNIITPELALITNISYDHTQYLGDTLPKIAFEKAGIIKPKVPIVVSESTLEEVNEVFRRVASEQDSPLYFASHYLRVENAHLHEGSLQLDVVPQREPFSRYPVLTLDLAGTYQQKNILGVLCALEVLRERGFGVPREAIYAGLAGVVATTGLKGRWQKLAEVPLTYCDTAHNHAGLSEVLSQVLSLPARQWRFILGFVADKDISSVLPLFPTDATYYFCEPSNQRALKASELRLRALEHGLRGEVFPEVNEALKMAFAEASPEDVLYVGGSTFVVADLTSL